MEYKFKRRILTEKLDQGLEFHEVIEGGSQDEVDFLTDTMNGLVDKALDETFEELSEGGNGELNILRVVERFHKLVPPGTPEWEYIVYRGLCAMFIDVVNDKLDSMDDEFPDELSGLMGLGGDA